VSGPQFVDRGAVCDQGGGHEALPGTEIWRWRAVVDQVAGKLRVPRGDGASRGHGPVLEGRGDVDAVLDEQPDPFGHAVGEGPAELTAHHLLRRVQGIAQPGLPRTAVAGAEAELEQRLQVVVARPEHPVVQGLAVVGVGAGLEQQAGQRQRMRMPRLAHRAELTLAEDAGQQGKRSRQAVPEVAGVRIRAGLEQHPDGAEHGRLSDGGVVAGVGQVKQGAGSGTGRPAWPPRRGRRPGARPAAARRPLPRRRTR
jgi:hypothetical protein